MTLIAGFRCTDGFVLAADTEVTFGSIRIQGHKLIYAPLDSGQTFTIGVAGSMTFGMMAAQKIRDAFLELRSPSLADYRAAIETVLVSVHNEHVLKDWRSVGVEPDVPLFWLMIGVEDSSNKFAVFQTDLSAVAETDNATFIGSGSTTAAYFFERLSDAHQHPAAVTCYLAQQLFREIKSKGVYVGGHTEIHGRRSRRDAQRFFDLPTMHDHQLPIWGLDDILLSATRDALSRRFYAFPGKKISEQVNTRIRQIRAVLTKLYEEAHDDRNLHGDGERDFFLTEFRAQVGRPFTDF
jgi:ATP-dependent protease HslVU (ClpYQ) peptidase subunit